MTETIDILKEYRNLDERQVLEIAAAGRQIASHNTVELCSIVNIRSGACAEDCSFCAQSVHYETGIRPSPIPSADDVLFHAERLERFGVKRLSLVSSGKCPTDRDMERFLTVYRLLKERTGLALCASHGILTPEHAGMLKESGVSRYHHNLETGERRISRRSVRPIPTRNAWRPSVSPGKPGWISVPAGLSGSERASRTGWNWRQRCGNWGVMSIPLNVLMPVEGTPLGNAPLLTTDELLKTAAMFRIINPWARIRFAGGRPLFDTAAQVQSLTYGFDALMVGDYLTKKGGDIEADIEMLRSHGFTI